MKPNFADILLLSVPERIELVQDIWDSIAEIPEAITLSEEQKTELDRRLESLRTGEAKTIFWEYLRAEFKL